MSTNSVKIQDRITGEIKSAQYCMTPKYNWRYHVDSKPLSDRKFDKKYKIIGRV